jgi:hypothetical protein
VCSTHGITKMRVCICCRRLQNVCRNRLFRTIWSCKAGKNAILRNTNMFMCSDANHVAGTHLFLRSMICNVTPGCQLLDVPNTPVPAAPSTVSRKRQRRLQMTATQHNAVQFVWPEPATSSHEQTSKSMQGAAKHIIPFMQDMATHRASGAPTMVGIVSTVAFMGRHAYMTQQCGAGENSNVHRPRIMCVVQHAWGG